MLTPEEQDDARVMVIVVAGLTLRDAVTKAQGEGLSFVRVEASSLGDTLPDDLALHLAGAYVATLCRMSGWRHASFKVRRGHGRHFGPSIEVRWSTRRTFFERIGAWVRGDDFKFQG